MGIRDSREVAVLLELKDHPNIVGVKEVVVGSDQDKVYVAMEYMEHDMKGLLTDMKNYFTQAEVKRLLLQLLSAVDHLHENWMIHRDIKTSNLLLNNHGVLKLCDFGLARLYGSPIRAYTQLVVTLWYRCPELLLGTKEYSWAIDMWSVGCVFAEFLNKQPLFKGQAEMDQIDKIFKLQGVPNEESWPGYNQLPEVQRMKFTKHRGTGFRKLFPKTSFTGGVYLSDQGLHLLSSMLSMDPAQRMDAGSALRHPYFKETPPPKDEALMPTFPSSHEGRARRVKTPDGHIFAHRGLSETPEPSD
eukprot:TRINITY_DN55002_c0_g1_i1.p1 TRINITY_DN55002_c0_g1~~TRINITY_DN55002_c0_g1_i1.p1  ORF type:complete len:318 (-),score=48.75 TRINITY_DN55002_c0_g1_i1:173-1078(-)